MADNIKKISKKDISMFYTNKYDASNQANAKHANQGVLEDVLEVTFDENGIGLVKNRGVAVGFINKDELTDENTVMEVQDVENNTTPVETITEEPKEEVVEQVQEVENNTTPVETITEEPPKEEVVEQVQEVEYPSTPVETITEEPPKEEVVEQIQEVEESSENITLNTDDLIDAQQNNTTPVVEHIEEVNDPSRGIDYLKDKYSQGINSKSKASDIAKSSLGVVTLDNRNYRIVPDESYNKQEGTLSQSDYDLMVAVIAGEGANNKSDMLAVTCTVLNRLEKAGSGTSVRDVLEKDYFPFGKSYLAYQPGGRYYNTDWGQQKLHDAQSVLNDAICGIRNVNPDVIYYSGDGTRNYFSDHL